MLQFEGEGKFGRVSLFLFDGHLIEGVTGTAASVLGLGVSALEFFLGGIFWRHSFRRR